MASDAPRLDDLIELVRSRAADDPLAQLQEAAALKAELDELTDALLGHFVDQARRSGATWTQIGDALGVSKQAAQQRHSSTESVARRILSSVLPKPGGTFTRFTPRARAVVVAAQQAAVGFGAAVVGTEHMLIGLYAEPEGIAAKVLDELGFSRESATEALLASAGEVTGPTRGHVPFTRGSKEALELALREALALGHNYIGTEHILLALLALDESEPGAALLAGAGITADAAREEVLRLLRQR
jgi:hypothetical protein